MGDHFIGIDVGTGSARAAVFTRDGTMLAEARRDIALFQDAPDFAEHSSANIWAAVSDSVRRALAASGVPPQSIGGLGFDATCSLVVVGEDGRPLPVSDHGDPTRDVIVWMDHRALDQAERINRTCHPVLKYVGGTISPEMQTPKLLWLKERLPDTYVAARHFFDLSDYLGWRATGDLSDRAARSPANGPISITSGAGTRAISVRSAWETSRTTGSSVSAPSSSRRVLRSDRA